MDSRKVILLVGALIVAALTAFFARTLLLGSGAPQANAAPAVVIDGPEVLVATRALPVGTIIDATALQFKPWPRSWSTTPITCALTSTWPGCKARWSAMRSPPASR